MNESQLVTVPLLRTFSKFEICHRLEIVFDYTLYNTQGLYILMSHAGTERTEHIHIITTSA